MEDRINALHSLIESNSGKDVRNKSDFDLLPILGFQSFDRMLAANRRVCGDPVVLDCRSE